MSNLILTSEIILDKLIRDSVRKAINEIHLSKSQKQKNEYLTVKEAAEYLGIAVQTLYQYTSCRSISFIKKGKRLYFSVESLDSWLLEGKNLSIQELYREKLNQK